MAVLARPAAILAHPVNKLCRLFAEQNADNGRSSRRLTLSRPDPMQTFGRLTQNRQALWQSWLGRYEPYTVIMAEKKIVMSKGRKIIKAI